MSTTGWLDQFEEALREQADTSGEAADQTEAQVALALAAGRDVTVPDEELKGAVRRAMLVLAAGGDPNRGLDLEGRAVETVAEDIDSPFRRRILADGLEGLRVEAGERSALVEVIETLQRDGGLAWRAFSAARMVDSLAEDELADD